MSNCRVCKKRKLNPLFNLGDQFISNFLKFKDLNKADRSALKLGICRKCNLVQLFDTYDQKKMYQKYWYISGINETMVEELNSIVVEAKNFVHLKPGDCVLDIASNDGTLLLKYPKYINCVGIDPSDIAKKSKNYKNNLKLINNFFNFKYLKKYKKKFKIISNIAMFYDANDPKKFLKDVKLLLAKDGLAIIQISYTPLLLKCNEIGVISHEHLCYYTFETLKNVLEKSKFQILDIKLNENNGSSIRVFFTHSECKIYNIFPQNKLFIGEQNKKSIENYEKLMRFNKTSYYLKFAKNLDKLKEKTMKWLLRQKKLRKKVIGYGASTKGNVVLQYYKIDNSLIKYIAERNPSKYNLYTPGSKIKIISEEQARNMKPDFLFVFPWFFIKSIVEREYKILKNGTKIIIPQPDLTEIFLNKNNHLCRKIINIV